MTILHVSDFYLPRLGGIEMQVRDLATKTLAAGYRVHILTETASTTSDDLPVTRVPGWLHSPGARRQIDRLLDDASVVHCHVSLVSPFAWYVSRRASKRGIPVVTTMHSLTTSVPGASVAFGTVFRRIGAVHWTAVSSVAAKMLEPIVDAPVEVLPTASTPPAGGPSPIRRHPSPSLWWP